MSVINPEKSEYQTSDGLKLARDVSWVIRTLWGGGLVFVLATTWVVSLANEVKNNAEKVEDAATKEQMELVLGALADIREDLRALDSRQRTIQSKIDKLEGRVQSERD